MLLDGRVHGVWESQENPKREDKKHDKKLDRKHQDICGVICRQIWVSHRFIARRYKEGYKVVDAAHKGCEKRYPNNNSETSKHRFDHLGFLRFGQNFGGRQQNDTQKEETANHQHDGADMHPLH